MWYSGDARCLPSGELVRQAGSLAKAPAPSSVRLSRGTAAAPRDAPLAPQFLLVDLALFVFPEQPFKGLKLDRGALLEL